MNTDRFRQITTFVLLMTALFASGARAQYRTNLIADREIAIRVNAEQDTISAVQERVLLGMIDNSLGSLADSYRRGRRTGGYIMLGLGVGAAAGGVATLAFAEGNDAQIVGWSLIGGGALLGGLSLIPLKVKSETERLYEEFNAMPERTPEEIQRKYYYWNNRFAELAEKRKMERIIGGVTSIVTAAVASFAVDIPRKERLHTFIWPALGGVSSLIIKTDVERRYETYRSAREDLLNRNVRAEVRFGIAPLPAGGFVGGLRVSLR